MCPRLAIKDHRTLIKKLTSGSISRSDQSVLTAMPRIREFSESGILRLQIGPCTDCVLGLCNIMTYIPHGQPEGRRFADENGAIRSPNDGNAMSRQEM